MVGEDRHIGWLPGFQFQWLGGTCHALNETIWEEKQVGGRAVNSVSTRSRIPIQKRCKAAGLWDWCQNYVNKNQHSCLFGWGGMGKTSGKWWGLQLLPPSWIQHGHCIGCKRQKPNGSKLKDQGEIYYIKKEIGVAPQEWLDPGAFMLAEHFLLLISNFCFSVSVSFSLSYSRQTFSAQEGTQGLWTNILPAWPPVREKPIPFQAPGLTKSQGKVLTVLVWLQTHFLNQPLHLKGTKRKDGKNPAMAIPPAYEIGWLGDGCRISRRDSKKNLDMWAWGSQESCTWKT